MATIKYDVATGARFTRADAQIIGPELERIATSNGQDNILSLDDKIILAEIKSNKKSPLWQYLDSPKDAVEARWLEQCGQMRRGVRIIRVQVVHEPAGKPHMVPVPMFKAVKPDAVKSTTGKTVNTNVHINAVLSDASLLASCLSVEVAKLRNAATSLAQVIELAEVPVSPEVRQLSDAVQAALGKYKQ